FRDVSGIERFSELSRIAALLGDPRGEALFVEQRLVLLVDRSEQWTVELLEIACHLECVVRPHELPPVAPSKRDWHAYEYGVFRERRGPLRHRGIKVCAMRTPVREKLDDLDLAGGAHRLQRGQQRVVSTLYYICA